MSFLAPWFLAGAVLIAGPIVAHLIRRATRQRVAFSATRLLDPSAPRLNRRSQIQHPLLLALRCLIVLLLAGAFARPFLKRESSLLAQDTLPRSVVVVLDESASMQRSGVWDAAREQVLQIASGLQPADRLALLAASDRVEELVQPETWARTLPNERLGLVRGLLASREPGWGRAYLDLALESALEHLEHLADASSPSSQKQIVLISDLVGGARVAGLAGRDWPSDTEVTFERVAAETRGNAGVHWLGWIPETGSGPAARVRISQSAEGRFTSLRLQLRDAASGQAIGEAIDAGSVPGESRVLTIPVPADHPGPMRLDLEGDEEAYDNTLWVVRPEPRELRVLYFGDHGPADTGHARFYLDRAVAGWRDPLVRLETVAPGQPVELPPADALQFYVIAEPLERTRAEAIRERLRQGAFALVLLEEPAAVQTAAILAGEEGWQPGIPGRRDAMLGRIDFRHPLFELFADPRFSDFTRIRFWRPQPMALPEGSSAAIAAWFDDGSPAVIEASVGQGGIVVWGGGWNPASGQWVLSSKFVPWLQALAERAAGGRLRGATAEVGTARRLAGDTGALWRSPDDPAERFTDGEPSRPGVYQIQSGGTTRWVALQVPAEESRVDPLPMETWEQLGVPLKSEIVAGLTAPAEPLGGRPPAELEEDQKLWRWFLIGAALLLASESLASSLVARREQRLEA